MLKYWFFFSRCESCQGTAFKRKPRRIEYHVLHPREYGSWGWDLSRTPHQVQLPRAKLLHSCRPRDSANVSISIRIFPNPSLSRRSERLCQGRLERCRNSRRGHRKSSMEHTDPTFSIFLAITVYCCAASFSIRYTVCSVLSENSGYTISLLVRDVCM